MGFSSLSFTANLVPERSAVLIFTDDLVHLKRGFATVDGRRPLERRSRELSRRRRARYIAIDGGDDA